MLTIEGTRRASEYMKATDIETLDRIPVTERGERSSRWKGVQHGVLVRAIQESLNRQGWRTTALKASVYAEGAGLVGAFELAPQCPATAPYSSPLHDIAVRCFGFQHRNDSKQALRCGVGALVQVCSNGLHAVRFQAKRALHTSGLDLAVWIDDTVAYGLGQFQEQDRRVQWLRDHAAPEPDALLVLGRRKVLPWSLVGQADAEILKPRHVEFRDGSAWAWYNCVSEICKKLVPSQQPKALQGVCDLALTATDYN